MCVGGGGGGGVCQKQFDRVDRSVYIPLIWGYVKFLKENGLNSFR